MIVATSRKIGTSTYRIFTILRSICFFHDSAMASVYPNLSRVTFPGPMLAQPVKKSKTAAAKMDLGLVIRVMTEAPRGCPFFSVPVCSGDFKETR